MRFESFASIGFSLSLVAILVMYLLKRKYVDTVVPSHLLWNRVLRNLEANKPWQRLRNQTLFWIQMLIAALLVFALMEPIIPVHSGVKAHLVVIADTSASMSAIDIATKEGQTVSRLDQMKSELRDLVTGAGNESEITLIRIAEQPELIESRQTDPNALLESIDKLTVNYGISAYRETMSLASSLTRMEKDAEIIVYTDGQWTEQPAEMSNLVPIRIEQVAGSGDNVAIAQFGVKMKSTEDANQAQGVAVIRNWSSKSQTLDVVLTSENSDKVNDVQTVSLLAGEQKTLRFDKLPIASYYQLKLDMNDALIEDNTSYAFLSEVGKKRVLLLTEGNLFLEKALQLSGMEVVKIQIPQVEAESASETSQLEALIAPDTKADVILLDRVSDRLIDTPPWKQLLAQTAVWRIASNNQTQTISPSNDQFAISEHPINRYISMIDTHISQLDDVKSVPWGQPIIKLGEIPVAFAGSEEGQLRLLFNFDLHHSDLPLRAEFPILVRNSIEWLGESQMTSLGRLVAGTTKEVAISPTTVKAEWQLLKGSSASEPTSVSGLSSYQIVPAIPGLYQLIQKDSSGITIASAIAEVIMDGKESNTTMKSELVFSTSGTNDVQDQTNDTASTSNQFGQIGTSLMVWIAMLVLLLMLLEWEVYQRGNSI